MNPNLPTQSDILASLDTNATSPLDFIKKNFGDSSPTTSISDAIMTQPSTSVDPTAVAPIIVPDPRDKKTDLPSPDDFIAASKEVIQPSTHKTEDKSLSSTTNTVESDEDDDYEDDVTPENPLLAEAKKKLSPFDHIRDLRKVKKELKTTLKAKEDALLNAQSELEKYKKGELKTEQTINLEKKVDELKYYQELHDLRMSEDYEQSILAPLEQANEKARALASEYGVDPIIFDEVLELQDKKGQNEALSKAFGTLGALEAKTILEEVKAQRERVYEAEAQPKTALEQIKESSRLAKLEADTRRVESIGGNSRNGWKEALQELRESEEYPELQLTGDPEHDAIVEPIIKSAAEAYGKRVKYLSMAGTKDYPVEAAKVDAKMVLLSHAAAIIAKSRADHYKYATQIKTTAERQNPMIRPQIGKSSGLSETIPASKTTTSKSPQQMAADLLQEQIMKLKR